MWLENLFRSYGEFVRSLGGYTVLFLAVATVGSSISFALLIPMKFVIDHIYVIILVAILYLLFVASYIFLCREAEPPEPEPPQQVAYPHLRIFFKSVFPVGALAFFTVCDDPLKSIPSGFVPAICVSSYMHVLVILAILRRSQDYGVSDGCMAAAYAILFSWSDNFLVKGLLTVGVIVLTGLRNLQLQTPLPPILPVTARRHTEMETRRREKQILESEEEKDGMHKISV